MKDGKGQERTEINIIKIISHADEGVEKDRKGQKIIKSELCSPEVQAYAVL